MIDPFSSLQRSVARVKRFVIAGHFNLEHNERMDIFAATMLGKLDIVKAALAAYPNIVRVLGPHKIPLIAHAEKGGSAAVAVRDFLRPLVS